MRLLPPVVRRLLLLAVLPQLLLDAPLLKSFLNKRFAKIIIIYSITIIYTFESIT
jgi:hypothetical protein